MVQVRQSTTNQPREKQMRSEYIAKYLLGTDWTTEYKLGNITWDPAYSYFDASQLAMLRVHLMSADLVVKYPDRLEIYEFQIKPRWGKFGQLLGYLKAAKVTDTLKDYWYKPILGILVNAVEDSFMESLCHDFGLYYKVYSPDWLPFYAQTLAGRDLTPLQVQPP